MRLEILQDAGLTKNEALIYKALLELGPSLAGQISRKTGLHRRTVYDTTEMLIQKGLLGYILENNRRVFSASSPKRFLEVLEEKENKIKEILPEMMQFYEKTNEKQETRFFKGKLGLKTVFEDQLEDPTKEILIMGGSKEAESILPFYFKWYNQKRKKKKIKMKIIFHDNKKRKIPYSEIKHLPQKYESPMAINIYGEKVAIIMWRKDAPFAIVIKEKDMADAYKKHFEIMWKLAKSE
jgi:sugar-specific transcriptional regulator TrmB